MSVFPAGPGEEAWSWLSRYHADVIVCEYDLPGMTGIGLLQILRSEGILLPFIFFLESVSVLVKTEAYQGVSSVFITREGAGRKPALNLKRLILWAAGNHESGKQDICQPDAIEK